jgi:hypothetical protein
MAKIQTKLSISETLAIVTFPSCMTVGFNDDLLLRALV